MKSSGYLEQTSPASTANVAEGARPFVLETSWTRNTDHVRKYFLESPTITMEDESDSDVQVVLDNLKDLTAAVAYQVDKRIWEVASENQSPTNINSVNIGTAWDDTDPTPIDDLMNAKQKIREETQRKLNDGYIILNAKDERSLTNYIISNGSQFSSFASDKAKSGVLQTIAGLKVKVCENVTSDYALVGDLKQAVTWKQFKPMTSTIIKDAGIGKKIRVWQHGEAILERPKFLTLLSNTQA